MFLKIAKLMGQVEGFEMELHDKELRANGLQQELEKVSIISKDREKQIQNLTDEITCYREETQKLQKHQEQQEAEMSSKESLISNLQEKFLQSSQHILQETCNTLTEN